MILIYVGIFLAIFAIIINIVYLVIPPPTGTIGPTGAKGQKGMNGKDGINGDCTQCFGTQKCYLEDYRTQLGIDEYSPDRFLQMYQTSKTTYFINSVRSSNSNIGNVVVTYILADSGDCVQYLYSGGFTSNCTNSGYFRRVGRGQTWGNWKLIAGDNPILN